MRIDLSIPAQLAGRAVSEAQNERAGLLSPSDVANAELVKYGAITNASQAMASVAVEAAMAQAKEQATDAVLDLSSQLGDIDRELAQMPREVDAQGNLVMDDTLLMEREAELRQEAYSQIYEGLTNPRAKKAFEGQYKELSAERVTAYANMAVDRRIETLGLQVQNKARQLAAGGKYDEAQQRIIAGLESGVIGQGQAYQIREEIKLLRDEAKVTETMIKDNATTGELEALADQLQSGAWIDGGDMAMSPSQRYAHYVRVQNQLSALDTAAEARVEAALEEQYLNLLPAVDAGELLPSDLIPFRNTLDKERFDKLMTMSMTRRDTQTMSKSDSVALQAYGRAVSMLGVGIGIDEEVGFEQTADMLIEQIATDPGLRYEDQARLRSDVEKYVGLVLSDTTIKDVLDVELVKITGYSEGGLQIFQDSGAKENMVIAERLSRDYKAAVLKAGPKFDAQGWMDKHAPKYLIEVQRQTMMEYGISTPPMMDGQLDVTALGVKMAEYQRMQRESGSVQFTEENARAQLEKDLNTMIRLSQPR